MLSDARNDRAARPLTQESATENHMIVVLAEIEIAPENLAAMKDAVREMETASLAEAGCHEYCFSQELSHPEKLRIVELWESMDALAEHFGMPHMKTFNQAIGANPPKSMSVKVHELGEERSLPRPGS
jgi:quinol monooxygenase YgiN